MKTNYWLILAATLSLSAFAQQAPPPVVVPVLTNTPGGPTAVNAPPTVVTNAPAAKPAVKKPAAKTVEKTKTEKKPFSALEGAEPLKPGPAVVIASNVNVRGQAKLNSEVVTRLTKGDQVTVLEEITLKRSKPDEPSAWAKIVFPTKAHVWVNASFIDQANKTVVPRKLNLRTGPGENYSVAGLMRRGEAVKEVSVKEAWMEIEAPTNAYAFVAAAYLKSEVPTAPTEPAPPPTEIAEAKPVAPPPTEAPAVPPPVEPPVTAPPAAPPAPTPAIVEGPPPKRIVQREGLVRGTVSIQAPTRFALVSPDNGKTINYLFSASPLLDLSRYKGLRIIVTGEEGLDERWRNTPVITIQRIQVVE